MRVVRLLKSRPALSCMLWVALCFFLTSTVYMSWVRHLIAQQGGGAADMLSMVAGYTLQAAGLALAALRLKRRPDADHRQPFILVLLLFTACAAPALISRTAAGAIAFGLLMNLFCGAIAGYYLYTLAILPEPDCRGVAFGGGYGIATVALGVLALPGGGIILQGSGALLGCVPLALVAAFIASRLPAPHPQETTERPLELPGRELALACATAVLLSLVKNLGFGFPSADIESGLKPELSRMFYAVGLVAAGFINDRSRKNGAICTATALIIPFIMLGLAGETVSSFICWGLDYLFYGFFSVYRVVLFLDLAARSRRWELAPLGLLFGRLGDAAGTALCNLFADSKIALIAITAALFMLTVFLFYRLCLWLYAPKVIRQRSEQEVFDGFSLQHDLSTREQEVLRLLLARRSNGEIAEALFVSESTVKYHVHNLLQKTGCKNRSDLQKKYALALYPHLEGSAELPEAAAVGEAEA